MLTGFYSAASALEAASQMHEVTARNLANADMPGFRRQMVVLQTFDQTLSQVSSGDGTSGTLGTQVAAVRNVFEPGGFVWTGNSLDLALQGDGFFVVQGRDGPLYTRNGVFQIDSTGRLLNQSGLPVVGESGPLTVPPETSEISIAEGGAIFADGAEVGRLRIARFADPTLLVPVGTTLFAALAGAAPESVDGSVHQGYRELSNVQVVDELVQMIAAMRLYEAAQRALRSLDGAVEQTTSTQTG